MSTTPLSGCFRSLTGEHQSPQEPVAPDTSGGVQTGVAKTEKYRQRFWRKVDRLGGPIHPVLGRCWTWTAARTPFGYGKVRDGLRIRIAHVVAYELEVSRVEPGLELDHLCRNTSCCRPTHLEPVTPRENVLRSTAPSAIHAKKTRCDSGHEFTAETTYFRKDHFGRMCMVCKHAADARYQEKQRRAKAAVSQ